ncbi:MAG: Mur ligase family protein [Candidatus Bipolaricaulis sp.]|nr:Mur ligase family protein [Candidatus Bipolaricaulis sp.]
MERRPRAADAGSSLLSKAKRVPRLLRTPFGRLVVRRGLFEVLWPLLGPLAHVHRTTLGRRTRVVAVVGSFGKTTAAHAVSRALALKSPEGWNSKSYLAASVLRLRPWVRRAVIEVGISRPGQMVEYARIVRPDVVVVTSIGSEHGSSLVTLDVTRNEEGGDGPRAPSGRHCCSLRRR